MQYAHLSTAHLREAVNKASLGQSTARSTNETVTKTVTEQNQTITVGQGRNAEAIEELAGASGGAGRVRTAASQFCRLLP